MIQNLSRSPEPRGPGLLAIWSRDGKVLHAGYEGYSPPSFSLCEAILGKVGVGKWERAPDRLKCRVCDELARSRETQVGKGCDGDEPQRVSFPGVLK